MLSFKSGDVGFGFPVGLRIGLPGSAAEVIEEKEPGGDDQQCKGDETDGAAIGGHLSLAGVFDAQPALRKTMGPPRLSARLVCNAARVKCAIKFVVKRPIFRVNTDGD